MTIDSSLTGSPGMCICEMPEREALARCLLKTRTVKHPLASQVHHLCCLWNAGLQEAVFAQSQSSGVELQEEARLWFCTIAHCFL